MNTPFTYGLLLRRVNRYGTEYVTAHLVRRDHDGDGIIGCDSNYESDSDPRVPAKMQGKLLDGLMLEGFVSDYDECSFIACGVTYQNKSVDVAKAERMLKVLRTVEKRIDADKAYEAGDKLVALATALKLHFIAMPIGDEYNSRYVKNRYSFWTIYEGRNRMRELIEEARAATRKRLGKTAA